MALDSGSLTDALTAVFDGRDGFPKTAQTAGAAWASSYRQYAAEANAGPTAPLAAALNAAETALGGLLGAAFAAARDGDPSKLAENLDKAFVAFWKTPPVGFAAPNITGVVSIAALGVLEPALAAVFAAGPVQRRSAAQQAQAIAGVLDGWTRTVTVVNTPPGPNFPVLLT
jgi:hypothetical protein